MHIENIAAALIANPNHHGALVMAVRALTEECIRLRERVEKLEGREHESGTWPQCQFYTMTDGLGNVTEVTRFCPVHGDVTGIPCTCTYTNGDQAVDSRGFVVHGGAVA